MDLNEIPHIPDKEVKRNRRHDVASPQHRSDAILTMREVAAYLGVSRQMIYLLSTRDPSFQTFKVGAARRMRMSALERWVHQQETGRHDR